MGRRARPSFSVGFQLIRNFHPSMDGSSFEIVGRMWVRSGGDDESEVLWRELRQFYRWAQFSTGAEPMRDIKESILISFAFTFY